MGVAGRSTAAYDEARSELQQPTAVAGRDRRFVHGGFWRNFLVKYPEINEMYARMTMVSAVGSASKPSPLGSGQVTVPVTQHPHPASPEGEGRTATHRRTAIRH